MKKFIVFMLMVSLYGFNNLQAQNVNFDIQDINLNLFFLGDSDVAKLQDYGFEQYQDFNIENYLPEFHETRKKIRPKDIFKYLGKALTAIVSVVFSSGGEKEAAIAGLLQTACEIGADATSKENNKKSATDATEQENEKLRELAENTLELLGDDSGLSGIDTLSAFKLLQSQEEQYRFIVNLELDLDKVKKFVSEILYSLFWILIK